MKKHTITSFQKKAAKELYAELMDVYERYMDRPQRWQLFLGVTFQILDDILSNEIPSFDKSDRTASVKELKNALDKLAKKAERYGE